MLWEADSAHAWMAIHPSSDSEPPNLPFKPTIRTLFEEGKAQLGKLLEDQHQLIIILTLTRMLWSTKEFQASPINDLVRQSHVLVESKQHIQEVLDKFLISANSSARPKMRKNILSYVHRAQIVHLSHLYAAGSLMDWIYPILRRGVQASSARVQMDQWAKADAVRIRSVAYHSTQILTLLRVFPNNEPLEPFNAFHAGVVLWCMAGLLASKRQLSSTSLPDVKPYRIDSTAKGLGNESYEDLNWINNDEADIVSMDGVPDLCCHQGQIQVLEITAEMLERMQSWAIAKNFLLVIQQLLWEETGG